jgi:single-stranded-DNA-specific exonuclease
MVNYRVSESLPTDVADALNEYHPTLQQLLFARGITTKKEAQIFLEPVYTDAHDPFLLHQMEEAVDRILRAVENKEQVVIYSDYDCDGIPGAVILHDFFKAVGFTTFTNYIPHRHYEGFGFAMPAVKKLAESEAALIITIDCGTTDHEAVAFAKEKGIDVIITDHHEPKLNDDGSLSLPEAVAVVNPKIGELYPFAGLCGAAVVFKLVQALIARGQERALFTMPVGLEKWWLDMVGIATVADMVPLTGENRMLAHYGLHVLRKSRRPGLQQLLRKQRVEQRYLTEDDIGFTIGPRINAASRMDTPEDAFLLLATNDEGEASVRVAHLEKLNNDRRGQVAAMTKEAHKRLKDMTEMPAVLVLGNPEWRPALVGLVANKLSEEFGRPAFLWGRDGNGCFKGSCRSEGHTSVVRLMEAITGHLIEHGGHHQSGGFSVKDSHIHTFSQALCQAHADLGSAALIDEALLVDLAVHIDDIDRAFIDVQKKMAPFGVANPKPLYEITGVMPTDVQVFGKTKEHTKITFTTKGSVREAIAFFKLPEQFHVVPEVGTPIKLLAHLEESHFMGRLQTRLRLVDIVL